MAEQPGICCGVNHSHEAQKFKTGLYIRLFLCLISEATGSSYYTWNKRGIVVPALDQLSTRPWRRMGELMYRSTFSWPRNLLDMSGHFHALALAPIGQEAEWAPEPVWTTWRRENSWTYRDSNSDPSVVQPIARRYMDYAIPAPGGKGVHNTNYWANFVPVNYELYMNLKSNKPIFPETAHRTKKCTSFASTHSSLKHFSI
jgi:hypothetical protein